MYELNIKPALLIAAEVETVKAIQKLSHFAAFICELIEGSPLVWSFTLLAVVPV